MSARLARTVTIWWPDALAQGTPDTRLRACRLRSAPSMLAWRAIARPWLAVIVTAAASTGAAADTWIDPSLDEAARGAALVAVATVVGDDADWFQGPTTDVRLEAVIAGPLRPGDHIRVLRKHSHHGKAIGPPVGQELLLILLVRDRRWTVFTPSFGMFAIRDGAARVPLQDPSGPVAFSLPAFATYVRLLREPAADGAARRAFCDERLALARGTDPGSTTLAEVESQALAAEACSQFGSPEHAGALIPFLRSPYPRVRRVVVRGLAACGGLDAAGALLSVLPRETTPSVQSALGEALHRLAPAEAAVALRAAIPTAGTNAVHLGEGIMDPRFNSLPAPRAALQAALDCLNGRAGSFAELTGSESPWARLDPPEALPPAFVPPGPILRTLPWLGIAALLVTPLGVWLRRRRRRAAAQRAQLHP